ncbi:MAG: CDP-alcohol phosphatidyltransferase family protein [Actinomycetota bacterium]
MGNGEKDKPRVRDMPPPRETPSAIGGVLPRILAWPYRIALAGLYRAGFRPWHLTLASLATNVGIGILLLEDYRLVPGLLLLPAGLFDVFDGGLARLRGEDSRLGAFIDSVSDRLSDVIVFGCLFWSLSGQGRGAAAVLALVTLGISLGVSHIRAEAESVGVSLSEGFFQRLERYVALTIGLCVPGMLLPALAILVALGGVTLLQRVWSGWRQIARA